MRTMKGYGRVLLVGISLSAEVLLQEVIPQPEAACMLQRAVLSPCRVEISLDAAPEKAVVCM